MRVHTGIGFAMASPEESHVKGGNEQWVGRVGYAYPIWITGRCLTRSPTACVEKMAKDGQDEILTKDIGA